MLSIVRDLMALGAALYRCVETAEANQRQAAYLCERVKTVLEPLRALEECPKSPSFQRGITGLEQCLRSAIELIQTFQNKNWMLRALQGGNYKKQFKHLNRNLDQAIGQLQLGVQVAAYEEAKQAELAREDLKRIIERRDQIEERFQAEWKAHAKIVQQREVEIQARLSSVRQRMEELQHAPEKAKAGTLEPVEEIKLEVVKKKASKALIHSDYQVSYFELQIDRLLKRGDHSCFYLGAWLAQPVVIKRLEGEFDEVAYKHFQREAQVLTRLHHQSIVTCYGVCLERERLALIMEYLSGGSVHDLVRKAALPQASIHRIATDIVRGLVYLHARKRCHRQLSSPKVLLDAQGHAKLSGLAGLKWGSASIETWVDKGNTEAARNVGYQAPELFGSTPDYTPASDIYSFGMILWELFHRRTPFEGKQPMEVMKALQENERPALSQAVPKFYRDLIQQCWAQEPWQRPSSETVFDQLETLAHSAESLKSDVLFAQGKAAEARKDYTEAYAYYDEAVKQGHVRACANVGSLLLSGKVDNLPLQEAQAQGLRYLQKAADGGHERSQFNLAIALQKGDGGFKDAESARRWYVQLANNPNGLFAKQARQQLKSLGDETENMDTVKMHTWENKNN